MPILGAPRELLDEGRLAAAGLAGDKNDAALTLQRQVELGLQLGQLPLPGDKEGAFSRLRLVL